MKCINNHIKVVAAGLILIVIRSGCGNIKYDFAYNPDYAVSSFQITSPQHAQTATPFAQDICIVSADVIVDEVILEDVGAACLFDIGNSEVLFSKNAHERLNPASLTKIMTALVALKNGTMDQILTATDAVKITEPGAQLLKLNNGDTMTLDQALHILLMFRIGRILLI